MVLTFLNEAGDQTGGLGGLLLPIIYLVVIGLAFYFLAIRPQKKQQKQMDAMISALEVGDSVLTTSGFYGVVIVFFIIYIHFYNIRY